MKTKFLLLALIVTLVFIGCGPTKDTTVSTSDEINLKDNDTIRIANAEQEYEIIIIEPGFNNWMIARARPPGYYSQQFLENRNIIFVTEWNNRVLNPHNFDPNLYQMTIDYNSSIDYGYEVNYTLYYYFIYFQRTYKQRLAGFVPRI